MEQSSPRFKCDRSSSLSSTTNSPGPWAKGVTDKKGRFTLETRDGEPGAVVGPHKVGFEWDDIAYDDMAELKQLLAASEGADTDHIKEQIAELKKEMSSRPKINDVDSWDFEVPKEGTTSADFEIGK